MKISLPNMSCVTISAVLAWNNFFFMFLSPHGFKFRWLAMICLIVGFLGVIHSMYRIFYGRMKWGQA
jgi:uncharacterized oligopeptide transporter (OPT) family protein